MDIIWAKEEDLSAYGKQASGKVFSVLIKISDIHPIASNMIASIQDTSWIGKLDLVAQKTFRATSARTIERLVKCIQEQEDNELSADFGEYMVSDTAQEALSVSFNHEKLPLAELLKEKVAGNPGFDFHTVSDCNNIAFGEAKYSGSTSRYADALKQIHDFINEKKDDSDLNMLEKLVKKESVENYLQNKKAFVAAFSINANDPEKVLENAIKSGHIDPLIKHEEIYLVGILLMIREIIDGKNVENVISDALFDIHKLGPSKASIFELLSYVKKFHPHILDKYEPRLISLMGLFYKTDSPNSVLEAVYQTYKESIFEQFGKSYTPLQASARKEIDSHVYFSFSAPTSAGKSYLFRDIIRDYKKDIVIVVPSRALISEYYYEITGIVDNSVLVLQFVENIYRASAKRRIYIVTPERATELFKFSNVFDIGLILMDEAQISEEPLRGVKFDAFVRRSSRYFPLAKKVFAHPFVSNPDAQLKKHHFEINASAISYDLHAVGKIFVSQRRGNFKYFSPYFEDDAIDTECDIVDDVLNAGGTALIYVSKSSIYSGGFLDNFSRYVERCKKIEDGEALEIIDALRLYIGASKGSKEKKSTLVDMMEFGIVVHHGSMPLKARLLIERFIRAGFAKICFATSTLNQGINMPFDVVWIDNFRNMDSLTLKNLIGRSGRTSSDISKFDFGYTIINSHNVRTFKERISDIVVLGEMSVLDLENKQDNDDVEDIINSVKDDSFNDDMNLPQCQIDRLINADIDEYISVVLDGLVDGDSLISSGKYYSLEGSIRDNIKSAFKKIYVQHLRREELTAAESGVLSASIPILLWRIQGKSFSEIVSLRYSYLSKRDERRAILRSVRDKEISEEEADHQLRGLKIKWSPVAFSLPQKNQRSVPLFGMTLSVLDIDYDKIVYDTYDYLDKVISLSVADPVCAAFELYYHRTQDVRAKVLQNYIRYGTNDDIEIWLLRYGIDPEDIIWLMPHIATVNDMTIEFKNSLLDEPSSRLEVIESLSLA